MPSDPLDPRISLTDIRRALPRYEHRYRRVEIVEDLVDLCLSTEERRRKAEAGGWDREAAEREGELNAYRFVLRTLLLSSDVQGLTCWGRVLVEKLSDHLEG